MREPIKQHIIRNEAAEQHRTDTNAAWNNYASTGLHATADEANAWLAKLESGEDIDPPEPHT